MISLKKYCNEYIEYGKRLGFFSPIQEEKFRKEIMSYTMKEDSYLEGDAYVGARNKTIKYNPTRCRDEQFLSQIMFNEFTHICSNIHKQLLKKETSSGQLTTETGLWERLQNHIEVFTDARIDISDKNNPFNYIKFGGLFMDEVIAEYVAIEMIKLKYNIPIQQQKRIFDCGDGNRITYRSSFDYYGIGEKILNEFAQTLFMQGTKNLHSLARESFKENFVYNLIKQHNERISSRKAFIEELALMGVIAHTIEKKHGHYLEQEAISGDVVYDSIFRLTDLIRAGFEDRKTMPQNIIFPQI